MENRGKRIRRLHNVLTQLHMIEEQKKLELQRRQDDLERSQIEVIHALNTDDALHGMFIDNTARLLKSLAQEAQRVAEAREVQSERVLDRARKMKTVERFKKSLEQITGHIRQENELHDVIERYVGRKSASLPQD